MIYLEILSAWMLADFESGLVHWVMDKKLTLGSGVLQNIAVDNEVHHSYPREMLKLRVWQNAGSACIVAISIGVSLFLIGAPMVIWLSFIFLSFSNVVHRYCHSPMYEVPSIVLFLQWTGLFQTPSHHSVHHKKEGKWVKRSEASRRYCVMTNYTNVFLDKIKFFKGLERII